LHYSIEVNQRKFGEEYNDPTMLDAERYWRVVRS
jgi:hypothetical protein